MISLEQLQEESQIFGTRLGRKIIQEQSGRERASNTGTGAEARGEGRAPCTDRLHCLAAPESLPFMCSAAWRMRPHQGEKTKDARGCGGKEQLSKSVNVSGCGEATYQSFQSCPKHLECDKAFESLQRT
jgi:hypothetical protein